MGRGRLRTGLAAVAVAVMGGAGPIAVAPQAAPPCNAGGALVSGGRVFPEPRLATQYVSFGAFQCGIRSLEAARPELVEIEVIGESEGGHPVYVVRTTDERIHTAKGNLYVMSSIHGDEMGGREGAMRQLEDLLDPELMGSESWVRELFARFVVHWSFPNPDGWVAGDGIGAWTRGNTNGTDLNRNYPVRGYIAGTPLSERESVALDSYLQRIADWYLGTDNHGQGPDTYAAAGLQIVGEFDYQKSETLARFADGITLEMENYSVLDTLAALREATGLDIGPYHWGTLYDMLGYSASGSVIDYFNTPDLIGGYGFATELTAGGLANRFVYVPLLNQVHVDSIRAINTTMFKQALDPRQFTYTVGGRVGYLFDPQRIRSDDADGVGFAGDEDDPRVKIYEQRPYDVTRMKFFGDLNRAADRPLTALRVADLVASPATLDGFDTLVAANDALPEPADATAWFARLRVWVEQGGNLVLTDGALNALGPLGIVPAEAVEVRYGYVGSVEEFVDRAHPLNAGLRGVASQTFDTVPIGYAFPPDGDHAPNWTVARTAWEAAGGVTSGVHGAGRTVYGELPVGAGRVRVLGALLPDPTERFYHPFGLQSYAVTYTGYTLLQNMLRWTNPARVATAPTGESPPIAPRPPLPATGAPTPSHGAFLLMGALVLLAARRVRTTR
jgi:hypothetical protein